MSHLVQLLASGLSLGAVYSLIAVGFVVIYRATTVFNFAQGELLSVGAFAMVALTGAGVPWFLALLGTMVITGAVAAGVERGIMRPLIGRPVFVSAILTIFVGSFLRAMIIIVWGVEPRGMPTPWETTAVIELGDARVLWNSLVSMAAGTLVLGIFFALVRYTRLGVAMRAAASDQETALAHGIPVGRILATTWFMSGAFAAVGGVCLGMFPGNVDPNLGFIALRAFPAVILGGLESSIGAVIAGILLGLLEVLAQAYLNPLLGEFGNNFHGVFPYIVMVLVLVVRPHGLLGRQEVERV